MRAWWWRSVAACASLAAVAGAVATVASALDADRADRQTALAAEQAQQRSEQARHADQAQPPPSRAAAEQRTPSSPAAGRPGADRVVDPGLGVSVAVPAGWRRVPGQRLVPAPAGRFPLVLAPNDRAAVLVGTLDPARVGTPVDPARLAAEARRLAGAFADGANPDARAADVTDAGDTIDGRSAWTSLRRADGGPRDVAGTLVRVTAVEGAPRGTVAVAVVRPGPGQGADARAADAIVRSLDLGAPGPGGRPAEAARAGLPATPAESPRVGVPADPARPGPLPAEPPGARPAPRPSPPPARPGEP